MIKLPFLGNVALIFTAALLGGMLAKKLRLPLIIGYLFAGVIFRLIVQPSLVEASSIDTIAQIGVALLLFTIGLEFSLTRLKEFSEEIIIASFVQVVVSILFAVLVFPFFGFDFYTGLFLGTAFSLSSTAVVIKILSDKGELDTSYGQIATGWLLMQDLYTLPIIIILPAIGIMLASDQSILLSFIFLGKNIFFAVCAFFLVFTVGKKIVPYLLEMIALVSSRELLLLSSVAACMLFAYVFQIIGFSFALGAFVAGMLLSSSPTHYYVFAEIRPLRDLFAVIFFVSLSSIIDLNYFVSFWPLIIALTLLVIFSKFLISFLLMIFLKHHTKSATMVGLSLISVGEFAFILSLLGVSSGLIPEKIHMLILSVTFISLLISSPLLNIGEHLYYALKGILTRHYPIGQFIDRLDRSKGDFDQNMAEHVVILGHGRVGKHISRALELAGIPYLIVDNNFHLVRDLKKQGLNALYGDPAQIDVLRFARLDKAKAVILAYADRSTQETVITNALNLNGSIRILCRTHFEEDNQRLKSLGVEQIVQPEFEAAMTLTEKILYIYHTDSTQIKEKLKRVREESY